MKTENPKICFTACGILIVENKVLLIKHRKLNIWLCPGGHIEQDEMPHLAAEREFFEETGIKVKASFGQLPRSIELKKMTDDSVYCPTPLTCDLHWICKENYSRRLLGNQPIELWQKGCEQHFNQSFLVELADDKQITTKQDKNEVTDLNWFRQNEIKKLGVIEKVGSELDLAFAVYKKNQRGKMRV